MVCYKPWRRWVEKGRRSGAGSEELAVLEGPSEEGAGREEREGERGGSAEKCVPMRYTEVEDRRQGVDVIESVAPLGFSK